MLGESGDFSEEFPLRLIKVADPRFGKSRNVEVKLDTTLPKIIKMRNELKELKNVLPSVKLDIKRGKVFVGEKEIDFAPIEFCYYRYFVELKLSGMEVSENFLKKIIEFHKETFSEYDSVRQSLEEMLNKGWGLSTNTFRSNISKLNKKLFAALNNESLCKLFSIKADGKRGARFYGIEASKEKFKIR